MVTLVTGATGLLGNNILRLLLERGDQVRVLVRDSSDPRPLAGLAVEKRLGDIRNGGEVREACQGVSTVIHAAGDVRIGWSDLDKAKAINVEGTRAVAEAAKEAGARMIHVSTVDGLGLGAPNEPANEDTLPGNKIPCTYVVTKTEAEQVVLSLVPQGLDAVIVNPGFMLGPWDWKPSSGRMLLDVVQRPTPLAPRGGCTFCDVRDVAAGILAAVQRGETGRRYILGGHPMSYLELWRLFRTVTHKRLPLICGGRLLFRAVGLAGDLQGKLTGHEPTVNSAAIRMGNQFHFYSSDRAIAELGYDCRPPRETIADAWQWFNEHGYVGSARSSAL